MNRLAGDRHSVASRDPLPIVIAATRLLTLTGTATPRLAGQAVAASSMAIGLWWTVERIAGMV
ncbi:MAG: hypothetical protein RJQ21_01650 [Rhodospirillales bacterium]